MEDQFFTYNETRLHFVKSGNGPRVLLAFHGFGQDNQTFDALAYRLRDRYTLYIFDIFFHGKSEWNKGEEALEKTFWKNLLGEFLSHKQIDRFSLLGFSMGGKFALAGLEAFPEKVDEIFLLAPDGVKTSMWYSLATYPIFLRHIFKSMISRPNRFYAIANMAFKIRLIDKGILRFVNSQMDTEAKRQQVYLSWVVFRHLKFRMTTIAHLINTNNVTLTVIIGKHDKIITAKNMHRLLRRVPNHRLEILDIGHNGLLLKWAGPAY